MAAGDVINDNEHMFYILGGLDSNYTSLITNIISKKCVLSRDDIFTRMCMHKIQRERMNLTDLEDFSVNYAKQLKNFGNSSYQ